MYSIHCKELCVLWEPAKCFIKCNPIQRHCLRTKVSKCHLTALQLRGLATSLLSGPAWKGGEWRVSGSLMVTISSARQRRHSGRRTLTPTALNTSLQRHSEARRPSRWRCRCRQTKRQTGLTSRYRPLHVSYNSILRSSYLLIDWARRILWVKISLPNLTRTFHHWRSFCVNSITSAFHTRSLSD